MWAKARKELMREVTLRGAMDVSEVEDTYGRLMRRCVAAEGHRRKLPPAKTRESVVDTTARREALHIVAYLRDKFGEDVQQVDIPMAEIMPTVPHHVDIARRLLLEYEAAGAIKAYTEPARGAARKVLRIDVQAMLDFAEGL